MSREREREMSSVKCGDVVLSSLPCQAVLGQVMLSSHGGAGLVIKTCVSMSTRRRITGKQAGDYEICLFLYLFWNGFDILSSLPPPPTPNSLSCDWLPPLDMILSTETDCQKTTGKKEWEFRKIRTRQVEEMQKWSKIMKEEQKMAEKSKLKEIRLRLKKEEI